MARRNILFDGNSAGDDGGAIHVDKSKVELTDGVFVHSNHAADDGGGFSVVEGTVVIRRNCTIALNSANDGGAVVLRTISSMELSDSVRVVENTAENDGGAFWLRDVSSLFAR